MSVPLSCYGWPQHDFLFIFTRLDFTGVITITTLHVSVYFCVAIAHSQYYQHGASCWPVLISY